MSYIRGKELRRRERQQPLPKRRERETSAGKCGNEFAYSTVNSQKLSCVVLECLQVPLGHSAQSMNM